jgi:hypothetical protein
MAFVVWPLVAGQIDEQEVAISGHFCDLDIVTQALAVTGRQFVSHAFEECSLVIRKCTGLMLTHSASLNGDVDVRNGSITDTSVSPFLPATLPKEKAAEAALVKEDWPTAAFGSRFRGDDEEWGWPPACAGEWQEESVTRSKSDVTSIGFAARPVGRVVSSLQATTDRYAILSLPSGSLTAA